MNVLSFSDFSSAERNFLSAIRTNAIFVGLTMFLMNMKHYFASIIILLLCTILQIYISYDYYNNVLLKYDFYLRKNMHSNYFYSIIFSLQLIFILIILLLITFHFYIYKI